MCSKPGATSRVRAQGSVVGVVLVLSLVLLGTAAVVTLGATALGDTQTQSELERAEHSLTLLNSRMSMVALGDSPAQTVSFGQDSGQLSSNPDDGWIRITHENFDGSGNDELLINESLGSVVYENDEQELAYQGGGVWRKFRSGDAQMVSPPEFHYRGATLTLPIVRVENEAYGSGSSSVRMTDAAATRRVFPNSSVPITGDEVGAPYNVTDNEYTNPVANGSVYVTVQSQYYQGWAQYFRERTDGTVTTSPSQNRVEVELSSLAGSIGGFEMPPEGDSLEVRGMGDDHPIDQYTLSLTADNSGRNFNNMHWSFYADEGNEQLELHFYSDGKCSGGSYGGTLDVSLYYYNTSGGSTIHEEWQNTNIDPGSNGDFEVDCSTNELTMDLVGSSTSTTLEYGDVALTGSSNKWMFGPEIKNRNVPSPTTSWGPHSSDPASSYSTGSSEELGAIVNHYFQLAAPRFDLTVTDGPGGSSRIDEGASFGQLEYDTATGDQYITFLHVTDNRVEVEMN